MLLSQSLLEKVENARVIRNWDKDTDKDSAEKRSKALKDKGIPEKEDTSNPAANAMTKSPKKLGDDEKVTLVSGNTFESLARTNPELFNREKLKILQASKDLVKEFNEFMTIVYGKDLDRLETFVNEVEKEYNNIEIDRKFRSQFNIVVYRSLFDTYSKLRETMSEEDAYKVLLTNYFPEGLTEDGIRNTIKLRLDHNKCLSDSLTAMLKQNYTLLNISKAEADSLIEDLSKDSTNAEAIGKVKEILSNPDLLRKYRHRNYNYDFRPLGGAYLVLERGYDVQSLHTAGKILHNLFKYDCIVCSHGNVKTYLDRDEKGDVVRKNVNDKVSAETIKQANGGASFSCAI